MFNLRSRQRRAVEVGSRAVVTAARAGIGVALRRLHLKDTLARLGLVRRRRRLPTAALLGAGLVVVAVGGLLVPSPARPRRPLRQRLDDLVRRGRYALLKAEYRMEERAEETAAKAEQKARVAEQIAEKEAESTLRGLKASLEEAKMAARR